MNITGKYCIEDNVQCEHLEIVSGGGWCHKDSACNKAPRNLPQANVKPLLCDVRAELEKSLLSENAPTLKQFEKWFAKGHNAAIKKALKIIDAHFA